jgi:glycosyltransferase involved in cell wall biosynthesis
VPPPTRILLLNDHLGWEGQVHGVARLFELWATHLDRDRFEVRVCILRAASPLGDRLQAQGVPVDFLGKGRYDPTTLPSLVRYCRRHRVDVLHVQGYGGATFGRMAGAALRRPVIVHFHDTTPNYPLVQRAADRILRGRTAAFLAVSRTVRDCWAARCGVPASSVSVVYNCVSREEFLPPAPQEVAAARRRLGLAGDLPVVGTVTRLFEEKGTRDLLHAVALMKDRGQHAQVAIVGDGPLRPELTRLAGDLGLGDRVAFAGYHAHVAPLLAGFDVLVNTSWFAEGGCPLPVLEAMAMAKALVVTDLVEIVEDGVEGYVIAPRRPDLLAERLGRLVSDGQERERMARAAEASAARFDARQRATELAEIYDGVRLR